MSPSHVPVAKPGNNGRSISFNFRHYTFRIFISVSPDSGRRHANSSSITAVPPDVMATVNFQSGKDLFSLMFVFKTPPDHVSIMIGGGVGVTPCFYSVYSYTTKSNEIAWDVSRNGPSVRDTLVVSVTCLFYRVHSGRTIRATVTGRSDVRTGNRRSRC